MARLVKCPKCAAIVEDVRRMEDRIDFWCPECKKAYYIRRKRLTDEYINKGKEHAPIEMV